MRLLLTSLLLLVSVQASAVIFTETWQSTITSVTNHTAFSVNDTFNWTVTYDDSSREMHNYYDGANGIAEGGNNDDTLAHTYCIGASIGCNFEYTEQPDGIFSDAVFDLSQYYNVMQSAGLTGQDAHYLNRAWRVSYEGEPVISVVHDDYNFHINTAYSYNGSIFNNAPVDFVTNYTSIIIDSAAASVAVPEPTTLVLMSLGLLGLVGAGRKGVNA